MISILSALAALIVMSLLIGYWHDDLFNGCRAAVLAYSALAYTYDGRFAAFTVPGLSAVLLSYVAFFAICLLLKFLINEIRQRRERQLQVLAEDYDAHHHSDNADMQQAG